MPPIEVEVAVQDVAGAAIARELGVGRIELCSALTLGGLTPSAGLIEQAVELGVRVHTLIRPRAGGFDYTPEEIRLITADIRRAVDMGSRGVVVGALDGSGMPDLQALEQFVEAAGNAEVTFHRAIDVAADIRSAARMLQGSGVRRILTSGGAASAYEGREMLADLAAICSGEIQVQAGAGITPGNVRAVAATGVDAVHFSAKRTLPGSAAPQPGAADFGDYDSTDAALAREILAALDFAR